MTTTATVTSKGQVTLPKPVRDSLGVTQGDLVVFEPDPHGGFLVKPAQKKTKLEGFLHKYLLRHWRSPTTDDIDRAISAEVSRSFQRK